ncbi:SPW repeat protein [Natronolimnohabitans sp. A-GB9]|uniref:SPW repeat domain-containing protein n=1 Tax=Natronolimnohabitans sp. A-GB9 TaxID=3069757 RepID=UPI0027AF3DB2|nr:SPW repeat protein [Natronolimnohabitans sp. A-GB9]MDQ2051473.1 SPW repeat protein [Natronolimnohabitans sp. A-GB9]
MSETDDAMTGTTRDQGKPEGQKWLSGIVSVIGLWIAISPAIYEAAASITWNNVLVGGAIFLLAGYNYYRIVTDHPTSMGVMSLVALLALWTIAAPFAFEGQLAMEGLEVAAEGLVWSNVISGILMAVLAGYVAYAARTAVRTGTVAGTR